MLASIARLLAILLSAAVAAAPAYAQSTRSFANTTTAAISGATPCTTPIIRTFSVTTNFIIGDVDLGVFATHSWRGDIQITLQSPAGTRQTLVIGEINSTMGDNFNVRLNDSGTQVVNTDDALSNHAVTSVPPYQHNFIPNAPLSVFNGQQSAGNWQLEICDLFPGADDGAFQRSDLFLTPQTNASGTGATFVVASTADSGSTTLRQAVIDANATTAEADTIAFAIPGAGPHTINVSSALPNLTDNGLLIDGTTQSGTQCRDLWAGNGHDLRINVRGNTSFTGFRMAAANQMIRG
ncbi:MAG: proprotein convertase P-domain-containing protein, partial [Sphingopyxis sp.]|nr:proprotein convertase P-domain-containing protein [Sphingopyxis sp.]